MHASGIDVDLSVYAGEQGTLRWPPCDSTALTIKVRRFTVSYAPAGSVHRKNDAEAALARTKSENGEAQDRAVTTSLSRPELKKPGGVLRKLKRSKHSLDAPAPMIKPSPWVGETILQFTDLFF